MKQINLIASAASRWINCPSSIQLENTVDERFAYKPLFESAQFGRILHTIGELTLEQYKKTGKISGIPARIKAHGFDTKHPEYGRMKHTVTTYVKNVKKVYEEHKKKPGKTKLYIEKKTAVVFPSYPPNIQYRCVAKADAMVITETAKKVDISVIDLKTGNYDYTESAFDQLLFTAQLVLSANIQWRKKQAETGCYVSQPFYYDEGRRFPLVHHEILSVKQMLDDLYTDVQRVHRATEQYTIGGYCMFCPALLVCPHAQERMSVIMSMAMREGLTSTLDISTLEFIYHNKKILTNFLDAIESTLKDRVSNGETLSLYMAGTGYGRRRWRDEKTVEKALAYLGDKRYNRTLKSPAQLEPLAGKENIKDLYVTPEFQKLVLRDTDFNKFEGDVE